MEGVLRLLRDAARPGRAVVVATHDDRLLPLADHVVELTPAPPADASGAASASRSPRARVLFAQGDEGDVAYVVEEGEIHLVRERADGGEELVTTHGPGRYFGELAPLFGMRRTASARAAVDTVVIDVHAERPAQPHGARPDRSPTRSSARRQLTAPRWCFVSQLRPGWLQPFERVDHRVAVVGNAAVLHAVAVEARVEHDVRRAEVGCDRVADAAEVDRTQRTDAPVDRPVRVPAEHDVGVAAREQRGLLGVGGARVDAGPVVALG